MKLSWLIESGRISFVELICIIHVTSSKPRTKSSMLHRKLRLGGELRQRRSLDGQLRGLRILQT